ncbi:hydroxyethylthiazole kinase [Oxalobacter formigenes]|uniref:Hydroxyethylthiazole kinase n=1 Tax=Oxalobacter formigenes OXCC13 TaxID=556269 RepID=C3XD27_OXAFO|nr:hydroxyethylthiazole kinase [Oxalobacter formigenes]ARQ46956.1 Hydroxyethylthiazole kinase [Oxalobacter formigenes]ARQ78995.1 hydroxyethylthiazole kinase [Oxalobacter formigenes OXCC13]EEO29036.1 hydroxyethylthiazole kinase [Oxalobacter formigenes OXCC13]MCZ4063471.1 hydroxyethylthiazole kinase [Oxalobacter formigenes]QDX32415.1 hydroxyethylthiazole kinase [Oxalobacter formigenes]
MTLSVQDIWNDVAAVRKTAPLVHSITNLVVMSYNANALLALGAAPVMAHAREEVEEMVAIAGALVLNIGTLQPEWVEAMKLAAKKAASLNKPIILDPVGAGATSYRNRTITELLVMAKPAVIRGNASEIMSVSGLDSATKGVESLQSSEAAIDAAKTLARKIDGTVCVSGATDIITDKNGKTAFLQNGHPWMTKITGTGCSATAMIGAFTAVQSDYWRATVSAMAYLGVVGEFATEEVQKKNQGVGSLQIKILDALQLMPEKEFRKRLKMSLNGD